MKKFRSLEDADAPGLPDGPSGIMSDTLKALIEAYAETGARYDPDADGHTVLIKAECAGAGTHAVVVTKGSQPLHVTPSSYADSPGG